MFDTTPASTSAWVTACAVVAVQVVDAPGANVVTGQVTAPAVGSVTARLVIVVVPVFLTRNDQAIVSPRSVLPSPLTSVTAADLVSCSAGAWATGVSVDGRVRRHVVALRVLTRRGRRVATPPRVDVGLGDRVRRVAVQVVDAPGANVVTGQVTAPAVGSLTTRLVIVVVPVFFTRNDQRSCRPGRSAPSPSTSVTAADLVSCSAGAWATGVSVRGRVRRDVVALAGPGPSRVAVFDDHTRRRRRPG